MSRFNSYAEALHHAAVAAEEDAARTEAHGIDRNPFCTQGARHDWQRGYDNGPHYSWDGDLRWNTIYQRGAAARRIDDHKLAASSAT